MRVEIVRSVFISGESVSAGSFVELSQTDANLLIGSGKAVPSPAPAAEAAVAKPAAAAKPQRKAPPTSSTPPED